MTAGLCPDGADRCKRALQRCLSLETGELKCCPTCDWRLFLTKADQVFDSTMGVEGRSAHLSGRARLLVCRYAESLATRTQALLSNSGELLFLGCRSKGCDAPNDFR